MMVEGGRQQRGHAAGLWFEQGNAIALVNKGIYGGGWVSVNVCVSNFLFVQSNRTR